MKRLPQRRASRGFTLVETILVIVIIGIIGAIVAVFIQAPVRGNRHLVESGHLVEVLPAFTPPAMPVSLVYPQRRHVPPRAQAMLQWLADVVTPALAEPALTTTRQAKRR